MKLGGTPPASLQSRPAFQQKETKLRKSGSQKFTWPFVLFVASCSRLLNPVNPVDAVPFFLFLRSCHGAQAKRPGIMTSRESASSERGVRETPAGSRKPWRRFDSYWRCRWSRARLGARDI